MFIILDTSILRGNTLEGIHFSALARIISEGYLNFRIPTIVDNEISTQRLQTIREKFVSLEKELRGISRNSVISDQQQDVITAAGESLLEMKQELLSSQIRNDWANWKLSMRAETLLLSQQEYDAAFQAYFEGSPPFEKLKFRNDIPDALIYQQILTLAEEAEVVFICQDGRLRQAADSHPNITVYSDLSEYLNSSQARGFIAEITADENLSSNPQALRSFLEANEESIKQIVIDSGGESLVRQAIDFDDMYGSSGEHTVSSEGVVGEVRLDLGNLNYFGDGEFELPVEFDAEALIEYFIEKGEYYSLPETEQPSVSEWNDYVYEAESEESVRATGTLRIAASLETLGQFFEDPNSVDIGDFEISIDSVDTIKLLN